MFESCAAGISITIKLHVTDKLILMYFVTFLLPPPANIFQNNCVNSQRNFLFLVLFATNIYSPYKFRIIFNYFHFGLKVKILRVEKYYMAKLLNNNKSFQMNSKKKKKTIKITLSRYSLLQLRSFIERNSDPCIRREKIYPRIYDNYLCIHVYICKISKRYSANYESQLVTYTFNFSIYFRCNRVISN